MMRKNLVPMLLSASLLCVVPAQAAVETNTAMSIKSAASPVDTATSADGRWFFVLTDQRQVEIYEAGGGLKDTIALSAAADHIVSSPSGERLYLTDKKTASTAVVDLSFVQTIDIAGAPFKGPEKAPVVIVVFSDFQCPYCSKVPPLLDQIVKAYPQDVKVVFKNFPLQMHQFARPAAIAALAAHRQGKFWQMHDKIFENARDLSDAKLADFAKEIGLDMAKFDKDRNDPKLQDQVQRDVQSGMAAEVRGTPTLFVNGRRVNDRSPEGMKALVEGELRKSKSHK